MPQARLGKGVTFAFTYSGGTFVSATDGNEVIDFSGVDQTTETKESFSHQSATLDKTYISSWTEPGEVTFTIFYTGQTSIQGYAGSLSVSFPTNPTKTLTVNGICDGWKVVSPLDDRMTLEVKFKLSGAYSWA